MQFVISLMGRELWRVEYCRCKDLPEEPESSEVDNSGLEPGTVVHNVASSEERRGEFDLGTDIGCGGFGFAGR